MPLPWNVGLLRSSLPMCMGYSRLTELNEEASTQLCACTVLWWRSRSPRIAVTIFSSAGDGVVAEFPSIVEAIRCAVEIQSEIAERNAAVPKDQRMRFRIGVNLGDVIAEAGQSLRHRRECRRSLGTIRRAWRDLHLANRLRSSSQDRRDPVPGHRRTPPEEHFRSGTCLSHYSLSRCRGSADIFSRAVAMRRSASAPAPSPCFSRWRQDRSICVSPFLWDTVLGDLPHFPNTRRSLFCRSMT